MKIGSNRIVSKSMLLVAVGCVAWVDGDDTPGAGGNERSSAEVDSARVTLEVARDRARLLHGVYASTLDVMHHHYFQTNRAVLPARAMEDVFAEMSEQAKVEARWISVNTPAMSVHHEPGSEFEKKAAEVLGAGKPFHEQVERGTYLRAAPIPLADGCVSCHLGFSKSAGEKPRFAGLVIRIPISD